MIFDLGFYIIAAVMLAGSALAVLVNNILHAALALIVSFFATAILYLMLGAEFTAIAQILVYIGGIVIFVLFTILLTTRLGEKAFISAGIRKVLALGLVGVLLGTVLHALNKGGILTATTDFAAADGYASMRAIGLRFLDPGPNGFLVPFEIISLLLLISAIGAIVIARKEDV